MKSTLRIAALVAVMMGTSHAANTSEWKNSMWNLSATLARLVPALASGEVASEAEKKEVLELSRSLSRMAHTMTTLNDKPNLDPSLKFVSREFRKDMEEATLAIERGDWTSGRKRLREVTRYCVSCHSLHESPLSLTGMALPEKGRALSELDRADYFAATRQFDLAIIHFENGLKDAAWARLHPAEWNDAIQKLLAIVVRVRNNPSLSLEMISRFFDTASYPRELHGAASLWRTQIKAWRVETRDPEYKRLSPEALLARAENLILQAEKLQTSGNAHSGFILYLRASSILHRVMASPPRNVQADKLLYLAGLSSEGMAQTNFWTLPDDFFRACIREAADPNGKWATQCHSRLGRSSNEETKK